MTYHELELQINNLVAKDEVEAAIALLSRYFHGDEKLQAIVLQSGRFHSLKKDQMNGVIDYATVQQHLNQLRASILDFVRAHKGSPLPEESPEGAASGSEGDIKTAYRASLARVAVALALREAPEGMAITGIQRVAQIKSRKYVVQALQEMEKSGWVEKRKEGRAAYWKLSERGSKMAEEFGRSLQLVPDEA
ncbi:MAG: hypothetical protein J5I94_13375 [Phaeodactylibacter sp.]|nr:hypothetical protein [Phaeodactylibacter sp.]